MNLEDVIGPALQRDFDVRKEDGDWTICEP